MSVSRLTSVLAGLSLAVFMAAPAHAAVNCDKNPSHPQCDGGRDPPANNPTEDLTIDRIIIKFAGIGKNKTIAECIFIIPGDLLGQVRFTSEAPTPAE